MREAARGRFDFPSKTIEHRARGVIFRRFWRAALLYWRKGPRCAWPLTISLTIVIFVSLSISYGINLWNRHFFDALEAKNASVVMTQALIFPALIAAHLALCVFAMYARMTMQRTWRAFLNGHLLDRWLEKGRYFQLNFIRGDHQNPEYRIADDVRLATDSPVDFVTGFVTAALSATTFIVVLWTIGGSLSFSVSGTAVTIPGFLVVAAVIYAVVASGSMVLIGRRFIAISEAKNQTEAEYRYALTRLRENAESVALLKGEAQERAGLDRSFGAVFARWRDLCFQHMRTVIVSQGSAQLCGVVPVLLCAPRYLDSTMSLGQVMQAASAFVIVQSAFSWIVDNYPRFADWTASAKRVGALLIALDRLEGEEGERSRSVARRLAPDRSLELRKVSLHLEDGRKLVHEAEVAIVPGEKVLLTGDSGAGKSSLIRAVAGLWPWGEGEICLPGKSTLFVLPQRSYLPIGDLRGAMTYPADPGGWSDEDLAKTLRGVGLGHLVSRMREEGPWDQTLSGGETQRLGFARLLLHRPDIVILDEATSALDHASQARLMQLLDRELPDATVISVGHRAELAAFHHRKLVMQQSDRGARLALDIPLQSQGDTPAVISDLLLQRRFATAAVAHERSEMA